MMQKKLENLGIAILYRGEDTNTLKCTLETTRIFLPEHEVVCIINAGNNQPNISGLKFIDGGKSVFSVLNTARKYFKKKSILHLSTGNKVTNRCFSSYSQWCHDGKTIAYRSVFNRRIFPFSKTGGFFLPPNTLKQIGEFPEDIEGVVEGKTIWAANALFAGYKICGIIQPGII